MGSVAARLARPPSPFIPPAPRLNPQTAKPNPVSLPTETEPVSPPDETEPNQSSIRNLPRSILHTKPSPVAVLHTKPNPVAVLHTKPSPVAVLHMKPNPVKLPDETERGQSSKITEPNQSRRNRTRSVLHTKPNQNKSSSRNRTRSVLLGTALEVPVTSLRRSVGACARDGDSGSHSRLRRQARVGARNLWGVREGVRAGTTRRDIHANSTDCDDATWALCDCLCARVCVVVF